jgi:hypothetical protein
MIQKKFPCCVLFALLAASCAQTPVVNLKPINELQALKVPFTRAYFSPSESGEDHIVLLSDPIDEGADASAGDALTPVKSPPIWQLLSIQLHWRSTDSPKEDQLVANNAVLHWYVYGKPTTTGMGVLHYVGTGSVAISTDTDGAEVKINHAELKLADQHGTIHDPFGTFTIKASTYAVTNPAQVQQCMDDVRKAIDQADHHTLAASTQP